MKPCYLLTYFGTIVYLDTVTSLLRHGKIGEVPFNVTAVDGGDSVSLVMNADGRVEPISDLGPGGCRYTPGAQASCPLECRPHGANRHTFHWSGRVLTAEAEGYVSLFRSMVGNWETFLLLTVEELTELTFILSNSWAQRLPARVFSPADIALQEGFQVNFGDAAVLEADMLRLIRAPSAARPSTSLEIVTVFDSWKLLFLRLYRPLVYLVAYGSPDIFACAQLAITSLREMGRLRSEVVVITDRHHSEQTGSVFGDGVMHALLQTYDVMDFALARYKIANFAFARAFQPIVYLDTDVICNAPLGELFQTLCFSDNLHAVPEGMLLTEADFYGRTLFQQDPGVGAETDPGFSTGILGFRNVACVETMFRLILNSAYEYARIAMRRDSFPAFDQPFANYVLCKGTLPLVSLERWAFGSSYVVEPRTDRQSRRGLIQFAGGVGNASPKVERMQRYLATLAAEAAPDNDERPGAEA
jgi:hypothetical protein